MKKLLLISLLSIGLFAVTGCYKDADNTPPVTTTTEVPDIIIETDVHGNFTESTGETANNYTIEINGESYDINQEVFAIQLEGVNKKNQHISIIQDGDEVAFANVSLLENDNNKINIKAFPAKKSTNLSANESSFNLSNTLKVQASSLNNEVSINYNHITDPELIDQMGRWGTNTEGKDLYLNTSSAFFIDSESLALDRNPLELVIENTTNEQLSLFHLNKAFHQWVLVENINQTNQNINLPQLGYYILANTSEAAFTEGSLSFEQLPLVFQKLNLSLLDNNSIQLTSTAKGKWSSFLPVDVVSQLSISDPCGNPVFEEELIVEENNQLFNSTLTSEDSENLIALNFNGLKCDGEILTRPGALIEYGSQEEVLIFTDEDVDIAILSCGEFTISGYDVNQDIAGAGISWNTEIEDQLEFLSVCEESADGFSFLKINGEMELLPAFQIDRQTNKTIFSSEDNNIRLIIKGEGVGAYMTEQVNFYMDDEEFGANGYRMYCENSAAGCGIDDCYISHFEEMSNGLTRISFSGVLWMQTIGNPTAGNYLVEGQIITRL